MRQLELRHTTLLNTMEDDSLNFGSDAAGATPGSNDILAQPPLQGETTPSGSKSQEPECTFSCYPESPANH